MLEAVRQQPVIYDTIKPACIMHISISLIQLVGTKVPNSTSTIH